MEKEMDLITANSSPILWHDLIKQAEDKCAITLKSELESYLVSLLMRYTAHQGPISTIFATAFLESIKLQPHERQMALQQIGDQCLLFTGLFPKLAEKRHVKISYFVEIGRTAYSANSFQINDLFNSLSQQFVKLMDVLQPTRSSSDLLLPIEAYEQWVNLGSKRALRILQTYTKVIPFRNKID
jgi:hypothetical protein